MSTSGIKDIEIEENRPLYYDSSLENWLKIYPATLKANPNYYSDNFYVLENSDTFEPNVTLILANNLDNSAEFLGTVIEYALDGGGKITVNSNGDFVIQIPT